MQTNAPPLRFLFVIDVQTAFFKGEQVIENSETLLGNIQSVIDRARASADSDNPVKIIWVRHGEANGDEFAPNQPLWEIYLSPSPSEPIVDKSHSNSFHLTNLSSYIKSDDGMPRSFEFYMTGLQSDACVEATTKGALENYPGAKVTVVSGAHGTYGGGGKTAAEVSKGVDDELAKLGAKIIGVDEVVF